MTRNDLKRLWFSTERIFLETKKGAVKSMPLEWFPRLLNATVEEREMYELSESGVHWETIDEDISFDGFFTYNKQEAESQRNEIQDLLKKFPMLNLSALAQYIGISPVLMRHYACNVKKPSAARKKQIVTTLHQLGKELQNIHL